MKSLPRVLLLHMFVHIYINPVDLQYCLTYAGIDVLPVTDKGVCIQKPPFFINRINRCLHSSETDKVYTFFKLCTHFEGTRI